MKAIFVNADGSTETREIGPAKYRVADFDRGKAWTHGGVACVADEGEPRVLVYSEIPWSSYSSLSPKKEKERQEELHKKAAGSTELPPVNGK